MSNIIFGYNNRVDAATVTSTGSWSATLPLANLQNRLISKVARTTTDSIADATINVDLGAAYAIGAVALIVHNISSAGLVRVRGDDASDFATPLYNSGWVQAWPSGVIPTDLTEWENDNFWLGTMTPAERAGYQAPYINIDLGRTAARYWRIEVDDTTNPDTYIQIGRLFMSDIWTPTYNYSYGATLGYEDPTLIETSLGGEEYFDQRSRYRIKRLRLGWVSETEAYQRALEIQRLLGNSGEVLVVPNSDDVVNGVRRNFVGRIRAASPIAHNAGDLFSFDLELKELL